MLFRSIGGSETQRWGDAGDAEGARDGEREFINGWVGVVNGL